MALTVGTNTYISRDDADDYFALRLAADAWHQAPDTEKEAALASATRAIDRLNLIGSKYADSQDLQFPRKYHDDSADEDDSGNPVVPQLVIDATCEEALALLADTDEMADLRQRRKALGLVSFTEGGLSETYADPDTGAVRTGLLSDEANELMAGYISMAGRMYRT